MRKLIRFKLLIVPLAVCLLLFVSFGGTAFASSQVTHPHLSGTEYVTSDIIGSAVLTIKGSGFLPSTTTTTNYAYLAVLASNGGATGCGNGGAITTTPVVDSDGSFSALISVCGLRSANEWFQIVGQDATTFFYSNIILTIANGRTGPQPLPHIAVPDHWISSGGCANLKVHGSGFFPSTTNSVQVSVFASTGGGVFSTIYPSVDSHGSISTIFPVCGLNPGKVQLEIASEDFTTFLYANIIWTTSG